MEITAPAIEQCLRERFTPQQLEVLDESYQHSGHVGANGTGVGTHFRVRIQCQQFDGQTRVACHRLVYDALHEFIDQGLHALAIEVIRTGPSPALSGPGQADNHPATR
jgi:BolA protein